MSLRSHAPVNPPDRLSQVLAIGVLNEQRKLQVSNSNDVSTRLHVLRAMLPNLSVLSLRCAPCGVTKQRFSALLPGMSLAEGEREPDVAEQDKTCQICQVYLRWPSWGFQPSDGDVYDKQKAYDKADIYTQEDQRAEYFSMADLAAEQIRTSDPSRTEIELLLPGCGDQFHKACISRWAQGSQQGHNRCPSCMASIDPTIMSTLTASGPPRDGKRARDVLGETVVEVEEEDESDDDEDDEDDEDHPSSYFFNIKRAINNVRARAFDVTDVDDVTTTFLWQFAFPSRYVQEDMVAMSVDTDACRMYLAAHHLPGTEVCRVGILHAHTPIVQLCMLLLTFAVFLMWCVSRLRSTATLSSDRGMITSDWPTKSTRDCSPRCDRRPATCLATRSAATL